jgi:hypothetical protein
MIIFMTVERLRKPILSHVEVSSSASFPALILINTAAYVGEPMLLPREMMLQWTMQQNKVAYYLTYYHIFPRGGDVGKSHKSKSSIHF